MWIFLNDAFLSVVAHRHQPNALLVRARVAGDLERVFPGVDVAMTPSADYRYRATVSREEVARVLAEQVAGIGYDNFKNSVTQHDRHDAYFRCWSAMNELQRERARG